MRQLRIATCLCVALSVSLGPVARVWAATGPPATPPEPVMVWPADTRDDTAEVERALRGHGHRIVPFAPVAEALRVGRQAQRERDHRALAVLEQGLARAQEHYLAQSWDAMLGALEQMEQDALRVVARPGACAILWEIEFRRGLGYGARDAVGDAPRQAAHFGLAFALDQVRRPLGDLYGPDVTAAFLRTVDGLSARAARPTALAVTPSDAQVTVDCRPVPGDAVVSLQPGRHVVLVEAPGYRPHAEILELRAGDTIGVQLAVDSTEDSQRRLAATWPSPRLLPRGPASRAIIAGIATDRGAARWVVLAPTEAGTQAELWHHGRRWSVSQDALAAAAAAQVLRGPTPVGQATVAPVTSALSLPIRPDRPERRAPLVRQWWFWTVLGVGVAATGLGLGLGLGLRTGPPERLQIMVRSRRGREALR